MTTLRYQVSSARLYINLIGLQRACSVVTILIFIFFFIIALTARQKFLEFVKFNFTGAILVDFLDQGLDVDRHLELVFDRVNEHVGVYTAATISISAHGDISVEQVSIGGASFVFSLCLDHLFELEEGQLSRVVWIRFRNHSENLFV